LAEGRRKSDQESDEEEEEEQAHELDPGDDLTDFVNEPLIIRQREDRMISIAPVESIMVKSCPPFTMQNELSISSRDDIRFVRNSLAARCLGDSKSLRVARGHFLADDMNVHNIEIANHECLCTIHHGDCVSSATRVSGLGDDSGVG
jgi:hypothetical protein